MAPLHFTGIPFILVTLATGFCFGLVLERSGFGNARNLAAQFYLYDMRVLKVMFTAIVTAMLLIFAAAATGLLDFGALEVPTTYLGPAIVGGLLLGVGFILGGYCPGTSLVSMSTLKIDGTIFVLGVMFGLFLFGHTVTEFWNFWNLSGAYGRWTLNELVGIDAGWAVLGVAVMAIGAFWFVERVEKYFRRGEPQPPLSRRTVWWRRLAVAGALGIAVVTLAIGQPTTDRKIAWQAQELDAQLDSRKIHLDPAEVLGMMHNNQIDLVLADMRSEAEYNLFHLVDAQRVTLPELDHDWARRLSDEAVVVVMSNDEQAAERAWKRLAVQRVNAYVLAGGINRWLDLYRANTANIPGPDHPAAGEDVLRHRFETALGDRVAVAKPDPKHVPAREFQPKLKLRKAVRPAGGGCG
ncbi:MAG TPA: YeeE/YedE thiosulfate transporter family protein [Candidatus Anammoximicrobium sp.]|nr:YeeE/YedE thiosulfate transporter family protein [Candidatus Anammoximicrobium sp.]